VLAVPRCWRWQCHGIHCGNRLKSEAVELAMFLVELLAGRELRIWNPELGALLPCSTSPFSFEVPKGLLGFAV
jgi:hypothetical protein